MHYSVGVVIPSEEFFKAKERLSEKLVKLDAYKDFEGERLDILTTDVAVSGLVGDLLMPFEENLEVEPYKMEDGKRILKTLGERYMYYLKSATRHKATKLPEMKIQSFEEFLDMYRIKKVNEDLYTTANPNPKWDWYQIGGRFANSIPVREDDDVVYKTYARVGDVIWERTLTDEHLKELEKYYEEASALRKDGTSENPLFFMHYPTLKDYINEFKYFRPYSLLSGDKWLESDGDIWFEDEVQEAAIEESQQQYIKAFNEEVEKLNKDDYLVIVDLHI